MDEIIVTLINVALGGGPFVMFLLVAIAIIIMFDNQRMAREIRMKSEQIEQMIAIANFDDRITHAAVEDFRMGLMSLEGSQYYRKRIEQMDPALRRIFRL